MSFHSASLPPHLSKKQPEQQDKSSPPSRDHAKSLTDVHKGPKLDSKKRSRSLSGGFTRVRHDPDPKISPSKSEDIRSPSHSRRDLSDPALKDDKEALKKSRSMSDIGRPSSLSVDSNEGSKRSLDSPSKKHAPGGSPRHSEDLGSDARKSEEERSELKEKKHRRIVRRGKDSSPHNQPPVDRSDSSKGVKRISLLDEPSDDDGISEERDSKLKVKKRKLSLSPREDSSPHLERSGSRPDSFEASGLRQAVTPTSSVEDLSDDDNVSEEESSRSIPSAFRFSRSSSESSSSIEASSQSDSHDDVRRPLSNHHGDGREFRQAPEPEEHKPDKVDGTFKYGSKLVNTPVNASRPFAFLSGVRSTHAGIHSGWTEPLGRDAFGGGHAGRYSAAVEGLSDIFVAATVANVLHKIHTSRVGSKHDSEAKELFRFMVTDFEPQMKMMAKMEGLAVARSNCEKLQQNGSLNDLTDLADDIDEAHHPDLEDALQNIQDKAARALDSKENQQNFLRELDHAIDCTATYSDGTNEAQDALKKLLDIKSVFSAYSVEADDRLIHQMSSDHTAEKREKVVRYIRDDLLPKAREAAQANEANQEKVDLLNHYAKFLERIDDAGVNDAPDRNGNAAAIRTELRNAAGQEDDGHSLSQIAQDSKNLQKNMARTDVEFELARTKAESSIKTLTARGGFLRRFFPDSKLQALSTAIDTAGTAVDLTYSSASRLSGAWLTFWRKLGRRRHWGWYIWREVCF